MMKMEGNVGWSTNREDTVVSRVSSVGICYLPLSNDSKFFSKYVFALWLRAPIE